MSKIIMICGSTGAGKTTYAQKLLGQMSAVHYGIDEFMKALFWMDVGEFREGESQFEWVMTRIDRCEKLIKQLALQNIKGGISAIMDLGFSENKQRKKIYDWCLENNLKYELHYIHSDPLTRWKRVEERNKNVGDSSLIVTRETFDWMEEYFKIPDTKELEQHHGIIINS
jgi:predicted kinase